MARITKTLGVVGSYLVMLGDRLDDETISVTYLEGKFYGQVHTVSRGRVKDWRPIGTAYLRKELKTATHHLAEDDIGAARAVLRGVLGELEEDLPIVRRPAERRRGRLHTETADELEGIRRRLGLTWLTYGLALGLSEGAMAKYELGQRRIPTWVIEQARMLERDGLRR